MKNYYDRATKQDEPQVLPVAGNLGQNKYYTRALEGRAELRVEPEYRGKRVINEDGTTSSERTITLGIDEKFYNVPSLFEGIQLTKDETLAKFLSGEIPAVGVADTEEEAIKLAEERSKTLSENKYYIRALEEVPEISKFARENPVEYAAGKWIYDNLIKDAPRSGLAIVYKAAEALNRGTGNMAASLDAVADWLEEKTGMEKGGLFENSAKTYLENAEYWRKKVEEVGVTKGEEMLGEAVGGAVPGITEFLLNVPYATIIGMAEAYKRGDNTIIAGIKEGVKRFMLGKIFKHLSVLKQPYAAGAMGTTFAGTAAAEGASPEEIAQAFGTGTLYGAAGRGGQVGAKELIEGRRIEKLMKEYEKLEKEGKAFAEELEKRPAKKLPGEITNKELPIIYHGSKAKIEGEIDLSRTQQRDHGFYGEGFYGAATKEAAKMYGGRITERFVSSKAKILEASLTPDKAPKELMNAVTDYYYKSAIERAKERGKEDLLRQEIEAIKTDNLEWKNAVDKYAVANEYDIIKYANGEIVVKNPKVLLDQRPKEKTGVEELDKDWGQAGELELPKFGEVAKGSLAPFQRAYNWLDVKAPFIRAGAKETADVPRRAPSIKIAEQERALEVTKKIKNIRIGKEGYAVTLKANLEQKDISKLAPGKEKEVAEAAKTVNKYFDEVGDRAIEDGVMIKKWPQSLIDRHQRRFDEYTEQIEALLKGQEAGDIQLGLARKVKGGKKTNKEKIEDLMEKQDQELDAINFLEGLNPKYVHVPMSVFINKIYEKLGPDEASKIIKRGGARFKGRFFKEKKMADVEDVFKWLLEIKDKKGKPIFAEKDFDIRNIMAAYAQDIARLRILGQMFKAAKKERLIIPEGRGWPDGYDKVRLEYQIQFPELKGCYIHGAFADFLEGFMSPGGKKWFLAKGFEEGMRLGRFFGYGKMMAFYNPIFLPMYDVWQGVWLGSMRSLKTPSLLTKGIKDAFKRTDEYYEAQERGAMSTPYAPPFENFQKRMMADRYGNVAQKAVRQLERHVVNPLRLVDSFYQSVWYLAWRGDNAIRMASYRYLKEKGYSPDEAAQITAHFHGDYGRLTPQARKIFNKIFFTPTFKYCMTHLEANMLKSAARVMVNAMKLKKPEERDMLYAQGLLMMIAGRFAKDFIMHNIFGFDVEFWGLKYSKEVDTEEGAKELVVYSTDPGDIILRYVYRWSKWGIDPDKRAQILEKAHWEAHPVWQVMCELGANRSPDGKLIYAPFTGTKKEQAKVARDIIWYSTKRIVGIMGRIDKELSGEEKENAYKVLRKDMGILWGSFVQVAALAYLRDVKEARALKRMNKVKRVWMWGAKGEQPELFTIDALMKEFKEALEMMEEEED